MRNVTIGLALSAITLSTSHVFGQTYSTGARQQLPIRTVGLRDKWAHE